MTTDKDPKNKISTSVSSVSKNIEQLELLLQH